ncbi:chitin synthase C [Tricladium varicosporioides]|nr:chitin synthase C [Hymenoscyphus varicosporioides]
MAFSKQGGSSGGVHTQPSLSALPAYLQSDTHITAYLASRFHVSLPTSQLSSHALISLNTYSSSTKGPDGGKEGSGMGGAEDLADRAWTRLGARSENQAVVFLGEPGSGKTTIRSHLLSALLAKSFTPLSTKLSLATYVFDTLTTTKTAASPIASKAGLFFELKYDTSSTINPTLIGGRILNHRLNRTRLTDVPTRERSFNILYYLLAGTNAAEKAHLGLDNPGAFSSAVHRVHNPSSGKQQKKWWYLGHPTQIKVGINDAESFQLFKTALRKLDFFGSEIADICQVLASILHIGQLEFETREDTTPLGDSGSGLSYERAQRFTVVKNTEVLGIIAAFLGVSAQDLQTTLSYKSKVFQRERVTIILDSKGARKNADELARTLYSLLVENVIESINQRVSAVEDTVANTISIVDFPGFINQRSTESTLDQLLNNTATELLYQFTVQSFFEGKAKTLEREEVTVPAKAAVVLDYLSCLYSTPATSYFDNSDTINGLLEHRHGLLGLLDYQTRHNGSDIQLLDIFRKSFERKNPAIGCATAKPSGNFLATHNATASFTVKHFAGEVEYQVTGLIEENREVISTDIMNLVSSTKSDFVSQLFRQQTLQIVVHSQEKTTIQTRSSSKSLQRLGVKQKKGDNPSASTFRDTKRPSESTNVSPKTSNRDTEIKSQKSQNIDQGAAARFLSSLDNITKSLSAKNTNPYFVFCLKSNDHHIANQFDSKCVRTQIQTFGITEISQRLRSTDFSLFLPFGEFLGLTDAETILVGDEREIVKVIVEEKNWPVNEAKIGSTGILLSERCWAEIAGLGERCLTNGRRSSSSDDIEEGILLSDNIQEHVDAPKKLLFEGSLKPSPGSFIYDSKKSGYFGVLRNIDRCSGDSALAPDQGDMSKDLNTKEQLAGMRGEKIEVEVEEAGASASRKRWLVIVWLMTWLIPDFGIRWIGRIPRKDVRQAWREKLAINMMIWFGCLFVAWFIVVFPMLTCPKQHLYSLSELTSHNGKKGVSAYVAIRGQVFDLGKFAPNHYPKIIPQKSIRAYAGLDATSLFPVQVSALCQGVNGSIDPSIQIDYTTNGAGGSTSVIGNADTNMRYHDFRVFTGDQCGE